MRKLKCLDLVFENTAVLSVPADIIRLVSASGITESLFQDADNTISSSKVAGYFRFEVNESDARALRLKEFPQSADETTLYDRLMLCNDIAYVHLKYDDGSEDILELAWNYAESDTTNTYQTVKALWGNRLSVTIDSNTSH